MIKTVKLLLLLFFTSQVNGQNMLPNPGFEVFDHCPDNVSQSERCVGWAEFVHGSPDYYNCNFYTFPGFSSVLGKPQGGTGVMGFIGGDNAQNAGEILTEQITGLLNQPIEEGKWYRLRFDLSITMALPTEHPIMEDKVDFGFHFYNQEEILEYISVNPALSFVKCNVFTPTVTFPMSVLKEYNTYKHFDTCFQATRTCDKVLIGTFCNAQTFNYPYSFYYFNLDNVMLEAVNTEPFVTIASELQCINGSVNIDHNINAQNGTISWSAPGSSVPQANYIPDNITYAEPGIYTINANYYQGCNTLHFLKTLTINNPIDFVINDTLLCPEGNIVMDMSSLNANTYLWDNGSSDPVRTISSQGAYWLQVQNGCKTSDTFNLQQLNNCIQDLFIPNSFTPNGDGVNDIFKTYSAYPVTNFEFKIFDRWGRLVFNTKNILQGWDGQNYDVGAYFFIIAYTNAQGHQFIKRGEVNLIR